MSQRPIPIAGPRSFVKVGLIKTAKHETTKHCKQTAGRRRATRALSKKNAKKVTELCADATQASAMRSDFKTLERMSLLGRTKFLTPLMTQKEKKIGESRPQSKSNQADTQDIAQAMRALGRIWDHRGLDDTQRPQFPL